MAKSKASDHLSISLERFAAPTPRPYVCFNMGQTLLALDVVELRLRFVGGVELKVPEAFLCPGIVDSTQLDWVVKSPLRGLFTSARKNLDLPEAYEAQGHVVWDLDDRFYCADLRAEEVSLFRLAYSSNSGSLTMEAPKSYSRSDLTPEVFIREPLTVLRDLLEAEGSLLRSEPLRCWQGDPGPKTEG